MDVITPKIESVQETPVIDALSKSSLADSDLKLIPLKGFFNINIADHTEKSQLEWVYNYFEKQGFQEIGNVLMEIQNIKNRLGMPPIGVTGLSHIYQYLKVLSQMSELEQAKKGFER